MIILLAEDHKLLRDALRPALQAAFATCRVVEAGDGREALALSRQEKPDLVVMDISMPGLNGLDAMRQMLAEWPDLRVAVLSMHGDRRFV